MMSEVVVQLSLDIERKLREKAGRNGQTLEAYLEQLARHDAESPNGAGTSDLSGTSPLSDEEFDQALDALSEGRSLPPLPADFSRSDIYADHD